MKYICIVCMYCMLKMNFNLRFINMEVNFRGYIFFYFLYIWREMFFIFVRKNNKELS